MTSSIRARSWAVVAISAAIGAALRWAAVGLIGDRPGLLLCNVLGCGVIGYAVGQSSGPWLTAGLCGALTSCSAIALQVAVDFDAGHYATAVGWLLATVVLGGAVFSASTRLIPPGAHR